MGKLIKACIIAGMAMAFAYAQAGDTTEVKDSTSQTAKAAKTATTVTAPAEVKKAGVTPKPPTNWSKIKDLFL